MLRRALLGFIAATLALLVAGHLAADGKPAAPSASQNTARATFAGGCFWCMEPPFDDLEGVISTTSGYIGGRTVNPTYEEVSAGGTGHYEAVQIVFDPSRVSYERLLEVFWKNIDPLDASGQFCDKGTQYLSAVFFHDEQQKKAALASREALEKSGVLKGSIVTAIHPAARFYPAEEYHQDYYEKNPIRYKFYRTGCGRDRRLQALWGK